MPSFGLMEQPSMFPLARLLPSHGGKSACREHKASLRQAHMFELLRDRCPPTPIPTTP